MLREGWLLSCRMLSLNKTKIPKFYLFEGFMAFEAKDIDLSDILLTILA